MTGYTVAGRHARALRDVVDQGRRPDPQLPLTWDLLTALRALLGCDHVMIEDCDYGAGRSYSAQMLWAGEQIFETERDPSEKARFWDLVRSGANVEPFVPSRNEVRVVRPTDFRSLRDWRNLPVHADCLRQGPGTTHELMLFIPHGFRRQIRVLGFREAGREFNDREVFDLELLTPHLEAAYRRGQRQRALPRLTPGQMSVLTMVTEGWTNQQIGRRMGRSEGTIRTHLNNIYARLGVRSRTEAVTRVFGTTRADLPDT